MRSHIGRSAFASLDVLAVPARRDRRASAVVSREKNDRVFSDAQGVHLVGNLAHDFVHVIHHGYEMLLILRLVPFVGRRLVGIANRIRRGDEGVVHQHHGIVDEERIVDVPLHEVANVVAHLVRAVLACILFLGDELAIGFNRRIPKALSPDFARLAGGQLPEKILLEARLDGPRIVVVPRHEIIQAVKLPLARNHGLVAGLLHHVTEGLVIRIQVAEMRVISEVVLPRHQLNPRGRADRSGKAVLEASALSGKRVDARRLVVLRSVAAKGLPANIVSHDENDVRFFQGGTRGKARGSKQETK